MAEHNKPSKAKIAVVDDHPIVRQGLTELITAQEDMTVSCEAEDVVSARAMITDDPPDLAIVDISLKDSNGIELIEDLTARIRGLPMLVLSMHDESFYAERVLQAGARGYITKSEASENVILAVRQILGGVVYLSHQMACKVLTKLIDGRGRAVGRPEEQLTTRQLEVFELIGRGGSTRDIAARMHISIKTVETHRANIKRKLDIPSGSELLRRAVRWVEGNGTE